VITEQDIAGCVIAGGLSRRMGEDKAFVKLGGETLVARAVRRLGPQVSRIAINANSEASRFARLACPVIADTVANHPGPLAGVLTAMTWAKEKGKEWVVTIPTDTPFFPGDLVARLTSVVEGHDLAAATSGGHRHPIFTLWPVRLAEDVRSVLVDEDERRVNAFLNRYSLGSADWSAKPFDPFFNINTPDGLNEARRIIAEFDP
jgi:molybdenum cofactor guanylyltransferase